MAPVVPVEESATFTVSLGFFEVANLNQATSLRPAIAAKFLLTSNFAQPPL